VKLDNDKYKMDNIKNMVLFKKKKYVHIPEMRVVNPNGGLESCRYIEQDRNITLKDVILNEIKILKEFKDMCDDTERMWR
jgi:hypothetical protein